jgi:hypothetical protein
LAREAADWFDALRPATPQLSPTPLTFTEPNLGFRLTSSGQNDQPVLVVDVDLDLEFRPPRIRALSRRAGRPYTVSVSMNSAAIRVAADEWDEERAPYPDGLA